MKSKIVKLFLFALISYAAARFSHHQTSGFRISKITCNYLENPEERTATPLLPEIDKILQGRFTYLGRGLQSFAFLSEDKNYVLKVFNNKMQKKRDLFNFFQFHEKAKEVNIKLERTFESYKIAYKDLKEETGLLYLHLNPSSTLKRTVLIIDKLGIAHSIDLDRTGFLIQKRAVLAYPWLEGLIQREELPQAKQAISNLLALLVKKCKQGIHDNDPLIRTNFGFINNQALQIDVGPFSKSEKIQNPEIYLPEIRRITASLRHWLEQRSSLLVEHLDKELEDVEKNA